MTEIINNMGGGREVLRECDGKTSSHIVSWWSLTIKNTVDQLWSCGPYKELISTLSLGPIWLISREQADIE